MNMNNRTQSMDWLRTVNISEMLYLVYKFVGNSCFFKNITKLIDLT